MKMEKNKKNFITGETYTLAELFSGNRRIVIPDLQRDYCWGDETNQKSSGKGELVTDFVNNLIEQYKVYRHDTLNLGLFYGYEVPANHIQLCDGQQRLTTLYLLLGMLNKKVGKFQQHLISDYEYYDDDKEPYLNYAIRESSLYFLSDLVCNFFISNDNNVDGITKADWFFNDYKFDPSICSMINALKKIEKILQEQEDKQEDKLDYGAFGDWVLNKLTFLYFDMENRKNGEETFVIINTTGEPLSATQNLKPLVINAERKKGMDDRDKQWEEIETWFWKNRCEDNGNDTADAGFEEFLRWVSIIEQKKDEALIQQILKGEGKCEFPYKNICFDKIYGYWKAFVWIMAEKELLPFKYPFKDIKRKEIMSPKANSGVNGRKAIGQNVCFVLLPLLSFVYKYRDTIKTDEEIQRNAKRVYEFFANLISIGNVSRNVNELVQKALLTIDNLKDGDIVSILDSSEEISKQILTEEERCKLEILRQNTPHRNAIEETFWEIQRHEVWQGEIMPLIESANAENGKFDSSKFTLNEFGKSVHVFRLLFCKKDQHDDIIYLLRRCVIMCLEPCEPYKPVARGYYYNTFGWTWNDWHEILCTPNSHHSRMKYLFKYILGQTKEEKIEDITIDTLATILEMFIKESPTTNEYIEFAKDDYLLSFTKGVGACDMYWWNNDWQICTQGGIKHHTAFFSRRNALILKEFGGKYENYDGSQAHELKDKIWGVWYCSKDANRVVFQCDKIGIKLDVWFQSNDKGGGTLNIELKRIDNKDISDPFPDIVNALQGFDRKDGNVVAKEYVTFVSSPIKKVIEDTMETVNTAFDNNMDSNNNVNAE